MTENGCFRTRNGRIKLKNPTLSLVRPRGGIRLAIGRAIGQTLDSHLGWAEHDGERFAGIAVFVWSADGTSTGCVHVDREVNKVPAILIPDYVRNYLLAVRIEDWTVNTVKNLIGIPLKPA